MQSCSALPPAEKVGLQLGGKSRVLGHNHRVYALAGHSTAWRCYLHSGDHSLSTVGQGGPLCASSVSSLHPEFVFLALLETIAA